MNDGILRKARESAEVKLRFAEEHSERIERCARALAARFTEGGRLFVIGNGGSACDAEHVAVEFLHPILERRGPLPAFALTTGGATLTAIGNDTDFSRVFEQQVDLLAKPGDALLGISTSGASANVNRALASARRRGVMTIGFAGRDGGRMVEVCEHAFVVNAWAVHRVQETHTFLLHVLWDLVHVAMGEDDVL